MRICYNEILQEGTDHYVLGFCSTVSHPRYLQFPTCVLDSWTLFDEARLFDEPFSWLTKPRTNYSFKHFCSVVQASVNSNREHLFNLLDRYKPIRSSGPWRPTVSDSEKPEKMLYLKPDYIGRNDGLTYRSKIEFFRNCKFNIAIQYTNTPELIQEKLPHAFAVVVIPIFFGNNRISNVFNLERFVDLHQYNSFEEAVEEIKRIDQSEKLTREMLTAPIFHNNQLPDFYSSERLLAFFDSIL